MNSRYLLIPLLLALLAGSPTPASAAAAAPMRVGTFNIRYKNTQDGPNGWEHRREHVLALIEFHEWDIFGVQEAVAEQMDDLGALSRFTAVGVGRLDGKRGGEYTAIFYDRRRFTMVDSGNFWLSDTPEQPSRGWDGTLNRICTWAKLRDMETGREFHFFNTHLDARGREARRHGANLLVQEIDRIAGHSAPVIVTGDFNCTPEDEPYQTMTARLRDSFLISEVKPYGPAGTTNRFEFDGTTLRRIDYIFVSAGIVVHRHGTLVDHRDRRLPSDHFPVMAKLSLP